MNMLFKKNDCQIKDIQILNKKYNSLRSLIENKLNFLFFYCLNQIIVFLILFSILDLFSLVHCKVKKKLFTTLIFGIDDFLKIVFIFSNIINPPF